MGPRTSNAHDWNPTRGRYQFSLRTMILLTTLVAVCLGLARTAVAAGVVFTIGSLPALLRTVRVAARRRTEGRPIGSVGLARTFLNSLLILFSMTAAWFCTFLCACLASALLAVTLAASMSRFLSAALARTLPVARWLLKRALGGMTCCGAVNRYLHRRFWLQSAPARQSATTIKWGDHRCHAVPRFQHALSPQWQIPSSRR